MHTRELFEKLYRAKNETEVEEIVRTLIDKMPSAGWKPIDGNESNYGIIENQQANPIAALVEKVTNSMDAILMKKCYELGINPKGKDAPKGMNEAVEMFFPNHKNWDLNTQRRKQAEDIQVLADGTPRNVSVIIYDNGEGQHPEDFERTFLSLVRGNKNDIMFVQGKYNMGGAGAMVFCGKQRYQLIASKKHDGTGNFGFTLTRMHPFTEEDAKRSKNTWYEYLTINDDIPAFELDGKMDLKLSNRQFETGSILKLYSYQFPSGYYGFSQDLNQSFNEFLFESVLPLLTVESKERYPKNNVLELDLYGLKRRLESEKGGYVEETFLERYTDEVIGEVAVTCYVFKARVEGKDAKKTKEAIQDRFFKNGMSVMFSINGQVHGSYTSEFIARTLKLDLLRYYLLIHVDCTQMKYDFRKELFMASRDRLKQGAEGSRLREFLGSKLRKSRLDEINKQRKESIGLEGEDTTELLKSFAKNLPKDNELFKLLQNTLKLEEKRDDKKDTKQKPQKGKEAKAPFNPKRVPSIFRLQNRKDDEIPVVSVPLGGEKTLRFDTDVEDNYFHRTDEPGDLQIGLVDVKSNMASGGDKPGQGSEVSALLNVTRSSPREGSIKVTLNPTQDMKVGDEVQIKISLSTPTDPIEEIIRIKIKEPDAQKQEIPKEAESLDQLGLPELVPIKEADWDKLESGGITMNHKTVVHLEGSDEKLEKIYVNLDSSVFLNHRSRLKQETQIVVAEKKYLSSVYFHALFLYMITKRRKYQLSIEENGHEVEKTTAEYVRDVFDSYYSDFLLNFGMEQLIDILND
ncbi:MAG: hypothetical protein EOP52_03845 [Sphingobacteriales bacterium]|nr:MAG: hypothetical protein EOP52_03845 [Sphingobacteriales bacterium]